MGQAIFFTGPDSPVHLQQAMFPASSSSDTLTFLFIIDRRTKGGECTKEREKEYYNTEEHIPCEPIHSSTPHARGVIDFRTTSSHTMPNTIYYLFVFLSWQLWLSGRAPFPLPPTPHLSAPPRTVPSRTWLLQSVFLRVYIFLHSLWLQLVSP